MDLIIKVIDSIEPPAIHLSHYPHLFLSLPLFLLLYSFYTAQQDVDCQGACLLHSTVESTVPLIVDTFMCGSMAREASLIHSDLIENVISITCTAEDWLYEEEVAAGGTDGKMATCPCPGLWITSRPLRLDCRLESKGRRSSGNLWIH